MRRRGKARKAAASRHGAAGARTTPIVVTEQERRRLIEDVAYFHAERFRLVESEGWREQDKHRAELEIATVLRRCGKP